MWTGISAVGLFDLTNVEHVFCISAFYSYQQFQFLYELFILHDASAWWWPLEFFGALAAVDWNDSLLNCHNEKVAAQLFTALCIYRTAIIANWKWKFAFVIGINFKLMHFFDVSIFSMSAFFQCQHIFRFPTHLSMLHTVCIYLSTSFLYHLNLFSQSWISPI